MKTTDETISLMKVKELFKQHNVDLFETKNSYEHYDLTNENDIKIEVKNRRLNVSQFISYSSEGFLLEKYKYDFLKENGVYVNTFSFFIDDVMLDIIMTWKLKNIEPVFVDKYMPCNTDFKGNANRTKSITYLKPEQGNVFLKFNEKWICITYQNLLTVLDASIGVN